MPSSANFIDYYSILRVNPNCSARSLESAYHELAKQYHPDHAERPDVAKLTEVINAYKALKDSQDRSDYDEVYSRTTGFVFSKQEGLFEERSALSDADAHTRILMLLYRKRREQAQDAGVGQYFIHEMLGCSEEIFDFHLWYLKEKGFIMATDQGTLAITIEGVDHVIAMSRTTMREKLLLAQPKDELEV
ncbi:MAG: DnaJ domain-containing protein [Novosphingobium sp.]|jgi:curved DNA-binding protein|uniref:DnaJ domain-containing protein n=1 Tax=Novosphingobium sp. TaxID=1874826 RepID=UPI0039192CE1